VAQGRVGEVVEVVSAATRAIAAGNSREQYACLLGVVSEWGWVVV
jgi:hypothetical protein